ncbi:MAG TPA: C4-type zinc ribbon domain-containing protein [Mycobacteriales bacterium]|nr:C4-type zinc ribbon domain-containing protein [Mycobacteriales bacterium]
MKADPAVQLRLLDLQSLDSALARLEHRRRTLPELAVIAAAGTRLADLRGSVVRAETEVGDLDRDLRRLENDVDQVRQRSVRDQQRMQSAAAPAKELESLQHEVESLARRQSDLEDTELEVMERREEAESRAAALRAELDGLAAERDAAVAARDRAYAEIDARMADDTGARAAMAGELPGELLALYEKVRAASGGVGAAELRQRRCEGCRLELAGSELRAARAAAPDEVLRCDNCRRILVRTSESAL